jgi:hypothetical protein
MYFILSMMIFEKYKDYLFLDILSIIIFQLHWGIFPFLLGSMVQYCQLTFYHRIYLHLKSQEDFMDQRIEVILFYNLTQ